MRAVYQKTVTGVLAALVLSALASAASTIVGIVDWDANPPSAPWAVLDGEPAAVSVEDTGGNSWLRIPLAADREDDLVTVGGSASDLLAGVWDASSWIEFDFWAQDVLPNELQVRWHGTASNLVWGATLQPQVVVGWQTLRAPSFMDWTAWDLGSSGTEIAFLADLASIDWIGVMISSDSENEAVYGVDDFKLMVPEPAEALLVAAALGVALLALRRRMPLMDKCLHTTSSVIS